MGRLVRPTYKGDCFSGGDVQEFLQAGFSWQLPSFAMIGLENKWLRGLLAIIPCIACDADAACVLSCRETEFTEPTQLRVFVGSWNVNGKSRTEDLSPWLFNGMRSPADIPDIYAIGCVKF